MLWPLALAVAAATLVQGITSFAVSQVVSIAGQGAITYHAPSRAGAHAAAAGVVLAVPPRRGFWISRVMSDAEGVRNLVGTGIIQLVGGFLTAIVAVGILFFLNWRLTSVTLLVLLTFGSMMAIAFRKLRPLFRERSVINADVTGRLAESIGGIRVVKVYVSERRERLMFTRGVNKLFRVMWRRRSRGRRR